MEKKNFLAIVALSTIALSCGKAKSSDAILFGTDIIADEQLRASAGIAKSAEVKDIDTVATSLNFHFSYYFPEAGESFSFRVCLPARWNHKTRLPLVMFLHDGWNDESSYLDAYNRFMIRLAGDHGYILVSPSGGHASFGNSLMPPAWFGQDGDAEAMLKNVSPERMEAQRISEKDVLNVLTIVMRKYPVDRKRVFLMGHFMGAGGAWYLGAKYPELWRAIATMSGPFVLEKGYPWDALKNKPVFISDGSLSRSLTASRELASFLDKRGFNYKYEEVKGDQSGMVPLVLPDIFDFFDKCNNN